MTSTSRALRVGLLRIPLPPVAVLTLNERTNPTDPTRQDVDVRISNHSFAKWSDTPARSHTNSKPPADRTRSSLVQRSAPENGSLSGRALTRGRQRAARDVVGRDRDRRSVDVSLQRVRAGTAESAPIGMSSGVCARGQQ